MDQANQRVQELRQGPYLLLIQVGLESLVGLRFQPSQLVQVVLWGRAVLLRQQYQLDQADQEDQEGQEDQLGPQDQLDQQDQVLQSFLVLPVPSCLEQAVMTQEEVHQQG